MESTPESVLETFERNRQAVRELLHFDAIVLKLVIDNLHAVNERWKAYLRKQTGDLDATVNSKLTADSLLKLVTNIRDNNSLRGQYRAMHNQCLVLLVSFFSSSTRALFRSHVVQQLQTANSQILREKLHFVVGDLSSGEPPLPELVADALEESKSISFADMKGIGRAFQAVLGKEPERDGDVNDIILSQACRHAIVHADGKVDDRLLKQIANATPRKLKLDIALGQDVSFTEGEIEVVGASMKKYLIKVSGKTDEV